MTIATPDSLTTGSGINQIQSLQFPPVVTTDSSVSLNSPSPFELLFSQHLESLNAVNSNVQVGAAESVGRSGETYGANTPNSPAVKLKPLTSNDAAGISLFVNPATLTQNAVPVFKTLFALSYVSGQTSNSATAQVPTDAQNKDSRAAFGSISDSTATANDDFAATKTDNVDQKSDDDQQTSASETNTDIATNLTAYTSFRVITDVITDGPRQLESSNDSAANGNLSEASTSGIFASDAGLKIAATGTVFNPGRGSDFGDINVEKDSVQIVSTNSVGSPVRPTRQNDDLNSLNAVIVQAPNSVSSQNVEADTPVSEHLAATIAQQLDDESNTGPTSIRIQLNQPGLGLINLHLSLSNEVVSVRIVTQNPLAKQIIESQMNDLRQSLNNRGVTSAQCEVSCDASGQQFSAPDQSVSQTNVPALDIMTRSTRNPVRPIQTDHFHDQASGRLNIVA